MGYYGYFFLRSLKLATALQDESVTSHHKDSRKKSFLLFSSVRCNRIDCIMPDAVISERKDWDHWQKEQLRLQFRGKKAERKDLMENINGQKIFPFARRHFIKSRLGGWFQAFDNRENTSQCFRWFRCPSKAIFALNASFQLQSHLERRLFVCGKCVMMFLGGKYYALNTFAAFCNWTFELNPDLGVEVRPKLSECLCIWRINIKPNVFY